MAKQRVNRLDKQKKPIKVVVQQLGRKLPFLLLIVAIAAIGYNLHRSHLFDPKINWTIDEKLNRSDAHYEQLIAPLLGNKYLINLAELKDSIEAEAWVSNAQIKRLFWNKIDIKLSAHIIAMRWQDNGYISTKGVLFRPETLEISQTPLAVVDEDKVLKFYKDYQLYQTIVEPLVITKFERNQIDRLSIEPNVGIILGHQNQEQRLKDFVNAYSNLKQTSRKIRKRGIFDMRYAKGFSLSYYQQ
jgi:cell division septal protein FtsQ